MPKHFTSIILKTFRNKCSTADSSKLHAHKTFNFLPLFNFFFLLFAQRNIVEDKNPVMIFVSLSLKKFRVAWDEKKTFILKLIILWCLWSSSFEKKVFEIFPLVLSG